MKVPQILVRSINLLAIPVVVIAIGVCISSNANAQPRPQRPPMETGPLPLPILAALPKRDDASFYAVREVLHGTVEQTTYKDVAGNDKRMHVYLPPGYQERATTYPVLYLNHGGGDDDSRWSATDKDGGHAHVILDNLIASQLAKPMIVIMPNTRGLASFQSPKPGARLVQLATLPLAVSANHVRR